MTAGLVKAIEWRPQAEADAAQAAWRYALHGGLALGERFLDALDTTLAHIAAFPEIGSARHARMIPVLPAPLRFLPVRGFDRYLVYYVDQPTHISVVRIWHASRDLDALNDTPADALHVSPDPTE